MADFDVRDARLLDKVRDFLRVEADDPVLLPLVAAAQQYLANAGVTRATGDERDNALYDLAVCIHVSIIYNGGADNAAIGRTLQPAFEGIVLQLRS